MKKFNFETDQFPYVKQAFIEEHPITDTKNKLSVTRYINKDNISLQFCGWEIFLSSDGTYHITDTSGG